MVVTGDFEPELIKNYIRLAADKLGKARPTGITVHTVRRVGPFDYAYDGGKHYRIYGVVDRPKYNSFVMHMVDHPDVILHEARHLVLWWCCNDTSEPEDPFNW